MQQGTCMHVCTKAPASADRRSPDAALLEAPMTWNQARRSRKACTILSGDGQEHNLPSRAGGLA